MLTQEKRSAAAIAIIMACRMLGLFMILPIFSLYAGRLPGATPALIGLALGIYGFTQAALQLPFGWLSDHFGRKRIITIGLLLFGAGSVVAALSHTMTGIIIGRALQGGGAVGSTLLALLADLTRDESRSKSMAMVGLAIGTSFSIALVLGPIINTYFHLNGIFWLTFGLALLSIVLLYVVVPTPPKLIFDPTIEPRGSQLFAMLKNPQLLRLDVGIFSMHAILTATFVAIPNLLTHAMGLNGHQQTLLYLVVLVLAFCTMIPFIIIAEKKRKMKHVFLGAVSVLVATQVLMLFAHHNIGLMSVWLFLFFTAFSLLEASLPSMISKIAPIKRRGSAMGIYSTSQFFGIFVGGALGGVLFGHFGATGTFLLCIIIGLAWLLFASSMREPPYLSTIIIKTAANHSNALLQRIEQQQGVGETAYIAAEQLLYVKIDKKIISEDELRNLIKQSNL